MSSKCMIVYQSVSVLCLLCFWLWFSFPGKKLILKNFFLQIAVLGGSLLGTFLSEKVNW